MSGEEFTERLREAAAPTADDVPITSSGERLDTKEKALAFCADLAVERGVVLELDAAAALLGMTRTHLVRLCDEGRVDCISAGSGYVVAGEELVRILAARHQEARRLALRRADSPSGGTEA